MNAAPTAGTERPERLLTISGLSVHYQGQHRQRTILRDIDLCVARGETIGIVGESGSGKSMLAKAVLRLLPRDVTAQGSVEFDGRNVLAAPLRQAMALRGEQMTLLYQDPFTMLNPLLTAGGHLTESIRANRADRPSRADAQQQALRRLAEVGIDDPDVAYRYPFQLSGGMRQRVALATALARDPRLLIADEPSTALDVTTQVEILDLLKSIQTARSMSLVLITHDLRVAFSVCDRIYVLYAGSLLEVGPAHEVESRPLHPYTHGLLLSEPAADRRLDSISAIPGSVPAPDEVAEQCVFSPRCAYVEPVCLAGRPSLAARGERLTACVRIEEIQAGLHQRRPDATAEPGPPTSASEAQGLLVADDVVKTFPGRRGRPTTALNKVSIRIGTNESVGLVGESGSGKTTLGRCLVGLETATSGTITINGLPATDYAAVDRQTRSTLRRTAQMVFQDPYSSLDPRQTVRSTLLETLRVNGVEKAEAQRRVGQLLADVGLPADYASRLPSALSGGERQRVAVARALAVDPALIVCDEPVSALDVSVQAQILTLLREIRLHSRVSYLFITHDLAVVRQIVDRVYVLHRGVVVEAGPVAQVMDHPQADYTKKLLASIPGSTASAPVDPSTGPTPVPAALSWSKHTA